MKLGRKQIIIILAILMLILLSIYFYFFSYSSNKGEIPFLKADSGPIRIKPDPEYDITTSKYNPIYDQIKSQKYNTDSVHFNPSPENPVIIDNGSEDDISNIISGKNSQNNPDSAYDHKGLVVVSKTDNSGESKIRKTKKHIYAQIASTRNKEDAMSEYLRISKSHSKLLSPYSHRIEKFDIKNKGRYYKLLVGPIDTVGKAQLICKKLIVSGISCIIKKL